MILETNNIDFLDAPHPKLALRQGGNKMERHPEQSSRTLYHRIAEVIEAARHHVAQTANLAMVQCYYEIGRVIVEDEQQGRHRAGYGERTLQTLSDKLTERYGKGFSYRNLKLFRQFYQAYSQQLPIGQSLSAQLEQSPREGKCSTVMSKSLSATGNDLPIGQTPSAKLDIPAFRLSWSHYTQLLRVEDAFARRFYEIEAATGNWSVRWLNRQIASSLYERVALSTDKSKVMELAQKGNILTKPQDVLKEPYVLEFLGMKEESCFTETELESRLITHLQEFLLELGNGFAFMGRQVRFSFEEQHFFVDLVFYNRLLRCFVLFDLKTGTLTHQDIGQMQMYVHYYDRNVKQDYENPTIGILLCKEKSDAVVKMTLPENENIYAAEYKLYLPDAKLLQQKLCEWIAEEEGK